MARRARARDAAGEAPDDAALLVAARRDPAAFGELFDRWFDRLVGFFAARTGCAHTAADLTAETLAAVYLGRRRFRPGRGPAEPWIWGIARNQLRRWHRSRSVDARARRRLGVPPIEPDAALEAVVERATVEHLGPALDEALHRLRPGHAEAVRLRVLDQLPYDAVAERLGCSEGAARVRVSRALAALGADLRRLGLTEGGAAVRTEADG